MREPRFQNPGQKRASDRADSPWQQQAKPRPLGKKTVSKGQFDVNENVYTFTSLKRRKDAVNALE